MRTRRRDVEPIDERGGVAPFFHFVTAVATDAIRGIAIAILQRHSMDALFIRQHKAGCRRRFRRRRFLDVTRNAHLLLSDFQLNGIGAGRYCGDIF